MQQLIHPDTGEVVQAATATAARLRDEGWEDVVDGPPVEKSDDEVPAKSASRAEWDEYARSQGLDPDEYSSKDELIEALG